MSKRTYYLRQDGSATPNKPWSLDHVMTIHTESVKDMEDPLVWVDSENILADIFFPSKREHAFIVDENDLLEMGLNTRLFIQTEKKNKGGIEMIGLRPEVMGEWIVSKVRNFIDVYDQRVFITLWQCGEGIHRPAISGANESAASVKKLFMKHIYRTISNGLDSPLISLRCIDRVMHSYGDI